MEQASNSIWKHCDRMALKHWRTYFATCVSEYRPKIKDALGQCWTYVRSRASVWASRYLLIYWNSSITTTHRLLAPLIWENISSNVRRGSLISPIPNKIRHSLILYHKNIPVYIPGSNKRILIHYDKTIILCTKFTYNHEISTPTE